jgi:ABC-type cobalamin/Fe3+-siderophores transport system ATPase subunit
MRGVEDQEFVTIVGPSGFGKTTLMRMVAGLETPTLGSVLVGDRPVRGPGPGRQRERLVERAQSRAELLDLSIWCTADGRRGFKVVGRGRHRLGARCARRKSLQYCHARNHQRRVGGE